MISRWKESVRPTGLLTYRSESNLHLLALKMMAQHQINRKDTEGMMMEMSVSVCKWGDVHVSLLKIPSNILREVTFSRT
ncbi:hypothetical protein CapIbe_004990 [Capra ibex]